MEKIYTYEDASREIENGATESEAVIRKEPRVLNGVEEAALQIFCEIDFNFNFDFNLNCNPKLKLAIEPIKTERLSTIIAVQSVETQYSV